MTKNPSITYAIVGAGPAGLTLARLLQIHGFRVKVYERDKSPASRDQGGTLDLHANSGLAALKAAGLLAQFKKAYRPGADRFCIYDHKGVAHYIEDAKDGEEDFDSAYARPEIDRGPLRNLLLDSLTNDTVVWNSHITNIVDHGTHIQLNCNETGNAYTANVLIGADGANSSVRRLLTTTPPEYAGLTIVEVSIPNAAQIVPELWEITHGGKAYALEGGKSVFLSTKGDGSLTAYTTTKESFSSYQYLKSIQQSRAQLLQWFNTRFAGWHPMFSLLFTTSNSSVTVRPQYMISIDTEWHLRDNISLIGDAAHLLPPSGDGVNQAMLDSLELAQQLLQPQPVHKALSCYWNAMQVRMKRETAEAFELINGLQSENNLEFMLGFFQNN